MIESQLIFKCLLTLKKIMRPRSLTRQMLILTGLVVITSALIMALLSQKRLVSKNRAALEQQVLALARSASSVSSQYLVIRDWASLEQTLMDISKYPGVTDITVTDWQGNSLLMIRQMSHEEKITSRASYQTNHYIPPAQGQIKIAEIVEPIDIALSATPSAMLQIWHPIDEKLKLGWIRVRYSLSAEQAIQHHMLVQSITAAFIIGLFTIGALYGFMQRALKPLERSAKFAGQLANNIGATLIQDCKSIEVEELTQALNLASQRLQQQMTDLQITEARTTAILATTADPLIGLDKMGNIIIANPAVASVFGVDPKNLLQQSIEILIPALTIQHLESYISGGIIHKDSHRIARIESSGKRNGDVLFPVEITLGESKDSGSLRYTCIVRDITEKKQAEEFMRLFSRALDYSNSGVVISDMSYRHHPIVYANPAFSLITGYELSDAIGRNCSFLQGRDSAQPEVEKIRQAIKHGHETTVTLRNYRKDGSLFWNELSLAPVKNAEGNITHYVGIQTDITERIEAELALEERTERLNALFSLSPDGFILFDHLDRLAYVNPAFLTMTGLQEIDLLNLSQTQFDGLLNQYCDNTDFKPTQHLLDNQIYQLMLIKPERRVVACQIKHSAGIHNQTILFFRDITRESEVDRMKSEFLSTAAHELRTPMASIFGFSELLLRRKYPEDRQRDMLETMHRQAALLIKLINELLDLARIEARQGKDFKISAHSIATLIQETVSGLMIQNDPRKVILDHIDETLQINIDPEKTRQALTNILSNAYKYSPQGGDIRLSVIQSAEHTDMAGIRVRDQGLGLSPEQRGRVFERFYRADPSGNIPGTGLGLCLVKEIVELQGGQIEIISELGHGTTVILWLPLALAIPVL